MAEPAAVQILHGKSEEQEPFRGETEDIRHHDSHHSYVVYGAQSERNQHNQYDQANLKRDKTIFSVCAQHRIPDHAAQREQQIVQHENGQAIQILGCV